ncbi:MAG: hypothetical protein L6R39_002515 [Caloplaca ligustica]|nr:MAG: hypothetical protein L6R39_002515 [Caloplaca ligustica]
MQLQRSICPELKDTRCIFDRISTTDGPGHLQLNREDIRAEAIIFTSAALEGVAAFLSPFVDNIIQHPGVYAELRAEIDNAEACGLLSSPVAKYEETCKLSFFMACVLETLRHDAPAQTILPRYVSADGIFAHNTFIPGGTEIAASPFIIHRDRNVFGEDADEFRPQRWLEDLAKRERMERFGMWFGYGDRECPGKNFAFLEVQKIGLELFRRFEIQSATPEKRFRHERWAVAMFWNHWLQFKEL